MSNECVENAYCDTSGTGACECVEGFYPKNGLCAVNIDAGQQCEGLPVNECVEHATCVGGQCVCDATTHYNRYGSCQIYVNATEPCEDVENECVADASCQNGFCVCGDAFYVEFGQCVAIKDAGTTCTGFRDECTSHASCVVKDLESTCVCDDGYYDK